MISTRSLSSYLCDPSRAVLFSRRKTKEEGEAARVESNRKAAMQRANKDAKALQQVEERKAAQVC